MRFRSLTFKEHVQSSELTISKLAETIGISQSTLYKLMDDKIWSNPTLDTVSRIAATLGCDPFDLISKD